VADVTDSLDVFVLNLDRRLDVRRVTRRGAAAALPTERRADGNELWIRLPETKKAGDRVALTVAYGGAPRVAPNPPWDGGVTWATTPTGAPWIATSCQTGGADLWWPVKDHPADEPDSMDVAITVPDSLVAASNGRLAQVERTTDSTRTFRWEVSTPINTYAVAMNVAPYAVLDTTYQSIAGGAVPVSFYALPGDTAKARAHLPQFLEHLRFLEETLGPYPFRADKYGIAQTPFLGMEHQTLIAYGNKFREGGLGYEAGFDALHFHELAHEWYGNCLTVADWKDFWLHEGTATYLEALYAESLRGASAYADVIDYFRHQVANRAPIARRAPATAQEMYNRDVYYKGALFLHTLRSMMGGEAVRTLLRRFVSSGGGAAACRHVDTEAFLSLAESIAGRSLDGVAETYLYQAALPRLDTTRTRTQLRLEWKNTAGAGFDVPVPVRVDGDTTTVSMEEGTGAIPVPDDAEVHVDPDDWILKAK
jgi:aminopeptidase N